MPTPPTKITKVCQHQTFGSTVCARCGQVVAPATQPAPRPSEVAHAFREGEQAAYRRVLAFLAALPEQMAVKTDRSIDKGRGAAYAAQEIRYAVITLARDAGIDLDPEVISKPKV